MRNEFVFAIPKKSPPQALGLFAPILSEKPSRTDQTRLRMAWSNFPSYRGRRKPQGKFKVYVLDETPIWVKDSLEGLSFFSGLVNQLKDPSTLDSDGVAVKSAPQNKLGISEDQKTFLNEKLKELIHQAGEENWDGEGALALDEETISMAGALIEFFPAFSETPDISATPHGEVDFDWCLEDGAMLTISVSLEGEIAYAWLKGASVMNAKEEWTGQSPDFIRCFFERLNSS